MSISNLVFLGLGIVGGGLGGSFLIATEKKSADAESPQPPQKKTDNDAELALLTAQNFEKSQQIAELQWKLDVATSQLNDFKKSAETDVNSLLNENSYLDSRVSALNEDLFKANDRLSNCSVNLQAVLNQSTNDYTVFINRVGTQFEIASFKDIPLISFEIYLTADRRARILEDLKTLFLLKCFNLPATGELSFKLADEPAILGKYSAKAFLSRIFGILYELNLKNLFLI